MRIQCPDFLFGNLCHLVAHLRLVAADEEREVLGVPARIHPTTAHYLSGVHYGQ